MIDFENVTVSMLCLLLLSSATVFGAAVSPEQRRGAGLIVRPNPEGELVVKDPVHKFQLRLPALYWECKSPEQLAQERGGGGGALGCSSGQNVPSSLLLVARNKDAQAVASLELKGNRFRVRGKPDLEEYVDKRQEKMMKQGGGAFNVDSSQYTQRDGMIIHKTTFSATQNKGRQKYFLVDFFVRPEGQRVRVYRLACVATPDVYERLKLDFQQIVGSFRYTGELADSLFTPDASPAELPSVEKTDGGTSRCGGQYSGMIVAMGIVFLLYMFFRRRSGR